MTPLTTEPMTMWQVPQVQAALIALVSVIIGAGISWFIAVANDRRKWRREDATRYLPGRQVACSTLLSELHKVNLRVPRGTASTADGWVPVWTALANVEILSSPEVSRLATKLVRIAEKNSMDPPGESPGSAAWSEKRGELLKAIRKELHVPQ